MTTYPTTGYTESATQTEARARRIAEMNEQHNLALAIVADVAPALNDLLTLLSIVDETSGEISEPAQLPVSPFAMSDYVADYQERKDLFTIGMGG